MIQRVGVIGAGAMGCGIAQLCAQSGFSVKIFDSVPDSLALAPQRVRDGLDAAVLKGKLTTDQAARAYHSLSPVGSLRDLEGADLVIEAASEDLEIKKRIFIELSNICQDAILATNTSSLSVAAIAEAAEAPERVLGMHFFNPPVAMRLVEMVRGPKTSPEAFAAAWDFALMALRRTPVDVKDTPGFIVNRVMRPYYLGGMRGAASAGGIAALDRAAREHGKVPMGPLELMDLIGLDVNLAITRSIYAALGGPQRLAPEPLQERLVEKGWLGRKSGRGFYLYRDGKPAGENPEAARLLPPAPLLKPEAVWGRLLHGLVVEARLLAEEGVAGKADIDTAVKLAMNFPKGPFEWLKDLAPADPAPKKR